MRKDIERLKLDAVVMLMQASFNSRVDTLEAWHIYACRVPLLRLLVSGTISNSLFLRTRFSRSLYFSFYHQ